MRSLFDCRARELILLGKAVIEDEMRDVNDDACDFTVSNIFVLVYVSFSRHFDYN